MTLDMTSRLIADATAMAAEARETIPSIEDIARRLVEAQTDEVTRTRGVADGYNERENERRVRAATPSGRRCVSCGEPLSLEQADRSERCAVCEWTGGQHS